jgi:cobalamin biosynthesis protein CobW
LANERICCTVADDFLPVMERFIGRVPASGILTDISDFARRRKLAGALDRLEVRSRNRAGRTIGIIDARAMADGRLAADEATLEAHLATAGPAPGNPLQESFEDRTGRADPIAADTMAFVFQDKTNHAVPLAGAEKCQAAFILQEAGGNLPAIAGADVTNRRRHHERNGKVPEDHGNFADVVVMTLLAATQSCLAGKSMRPAPRRAGPEIDTYFDKPRQGQERSGGYPVLIRSKGLGRMVMAGRLCGRI